MRPNNLTVCKCAIIGLVCASAWPQVAHGSPPYINATLDQNTSGVGSRAYDINQYGQVVGWIAGGSGHHAAHWYNEQFTDVNDTTHFMLLQDFTIDIAEAYAISDGDQVVGTAQTRLQCPGRTIDVWHAFVMRPAVLTDLATPIPGDAITELWTFGNPCTAYNSVATAISNANHVVGWADVNNAATIRAFLVRPQNGVWFVPPSDPNDDYVNQLMVDLGTLGGAESAAHGVNDAGIIVGYSYLSNNNPPARYHAFMLTPVGDTWFVDANNDGANDLMLDLGTLGGHNSWARAINNSNQVVGESDTADFNTHAFLWSGGVMTDLGTLGGRSSSAAAINEQGHVVGWAENAAGQRRAFIWINGVMTDLNSALLFGQSLGGLVLTEARGINDAGQIVGFASRPGGGESRPFLFTPATPAQIAAAAAAEAALNEALGSNGGSSGSGGAGGQPIVGTPAYLQGGSDPNSPVAGQTSGATLNFCGFGTAAILPMTLAGLIGMRRLRLR
jgi:probable HAF family extracellular repeat protein